jgi:hypothetical protein
MERIRNIEQAAIGPKRKLSPVSPGAVRDGEHRRPFFSVLLGSGLFAYDRDNTDATKSER